MHKKLILTACLICTDFWATGCKETPSNPAISSFLETDVRSHTVNMFFNLGHEDENLSANFSGYANGHLLISVPIGYKVILHVTNDGGVPYGAGVYTADQQVAFSGSGKTIAYLENNPSAGIMPGSSQKITFTTTHTGQYRLESLLYRFPIHRPSHPTLGMWVHFNVVASGQPNVRQI